MANKLGTQLGDILVSELEKVSSLERMALFYESYRLELKHWENTGREDLGIIHALHQWKKKLSPERQLCYSAIDLCAAMS